MRNYFRGLWAAIRDRICYTGGYRALFESSMDGILLTVPDGRVLTANSAACRMLGRSEPEICAGGRKLVADQSDPRLATLLEERARSGRAQGTLTLVRGDGSRFEAEISSAIFATPGGSRTAMVFRDISDRRQAEVERERLIERLQTALAEVKQLSGLLPICAGCKKIRDDRGYWNSVEDYIASHTDAKFTHGMCPECIEKILAGVDLRHPPKSEPDPDRPRGSDRPPT